MRTAGFCPLTDRAAATDGRHYLLTVAAPASGWLLRGMESYQALQYLDYVNAMSYDLHGAWNHFVGPNAALYDNGDDAELAAGGVYVSHMRGGYEANSAAGIAEVAEIARRTGVPVHVSHFHAEPPIVHDLLDRLAASGVDATFDAYPYTRGCSILAMPILPANLTVGSVDEVLGVLRDPAARVSVRVTRPRRSDDG